MYSDYDPSKLNSKQIRQILKSHNWKRWLKAEPYIVKYPKIAFDYIYFAIQERWPEAEPLIKRYPNIAYGYIKFIIKGKWPEAEKYMLSKLKYEFNKINNFENINFYYDKQNFSKICDIVLNYSLITKSRWPEIEQYVMPYYFFKSHILIEYYDIVKDKTQFILDNIKYLPQLINILPETSFPIKIRNKYFELFKMKNLGLL